MRLLKIENVNYNILQDFSLDLKHLNLLVIAGINGSGKTTLLDFIEKKLKQNKFDLQGDIYFEFNNQEIKSQNLHSIANKFKINISDIQNKLIYIKAKENKTTELKKHITKYLKYLIFKQGIAPKYAYNEFDNFLKNVFKGMDLSISFSGLDENENIYFKNSFNQEVNIDNLSTGEKEILNKVFYFFINKTKDSIILIDEPEISLHPSWQSYILKVYKNLADEFKNQIIIATHSPQIITATPNESLYILHNQNNKIVAKNINSYGKDINSILLEVMGSEYLRDIDVEEQIALVKDMLFNNKFDNDDFTKEFEKLECLLKNDNIELGFIKLELQRRRDAKNR